MFLIVLWLDNKAGFGIFECVYLRILFEIFRKVRFFLQFFMNYVENFTEKSLNISAKSNIKAGRDKFILFLLFFVL